MHGIIFLALVVFLESQLGEAAWPKAMAAAKLKEQDFDHGHFYPDKKASALFRATAKLLRLPLADTLQNLGRHMSPGLVSMGRSMGLVRENWKTMDILEHLQNDILAAFNDPVSGIIAPDIRTYRLKHGEVAIAYVSSRRLCHLLKGIIEGLGEHFEEPIAFKEPVCMWHGAPLCRLSVYLDDPLLQNYVDIHREFEIIHSRIEEMQIFNRFHGLPIHHPGMVLRYSDSETLVQTHREQLVAMREEKLTYIAAPHLLLGLQAIVKTVNLEHGTAVLHEISLTDGPMGKRFYKRVEPEKKIPVTITVEGKKLNGRILNISGGGIHIVLNQRAKLDEIMLFVQVIIRFTVPLKWVERGDPIELGPHEMTVEGNILNISETDAKQSIRIIFAPLSPHNLYVIDQYYKKRIEAVMPILKRMLPT